MKNFMLYLMLLLVPMVVTAQSIPPSQHFVTLSWQASPTATVTHYGVFRAMTPGGPYTYSGFTKGLSLVITKNPDGSNLIEGAVYYYVVVAFTDIDPVTGHSLHSIDSNESQVTIPVFVVIAPPTNLKADVQ